jgi:hypothetical protein
MAILLDEKFGRNPFPLRKIFPPKAPDRGDGIHLLLAELDSMVNG